VSGACRRKIKVHKRGRRGGWFQQNLGKGGLRKKKKISKTPQKQPKNRPNKKNKRPLHTWPPLCTPSPTPPQAPVPWHPSPDSLPTSHGPGGPSPAPTKKKKKKKNHHGTPKKKKKKRNNPTWVVGLRHLLGESTPPLRGEKRNFLLPA